jgi:tetratricopeptide (TPR) repeat protein
MFMQIGGGIEGYTLSVTRLRLAALFLAALPLFPQAKDDQKPTQPDDPKLQQRKPQTPPAEEQEPPEEDVTMKPKEYTFNPLQAEKELKIGDYYFKKGSFRAAAGRFDEATKWNPGMAEAYFKLGEAREKIKDKKSARLAFQKYLELEPDGKDAPRAKKALGGK